MLLYGVAIRPDVVVFDIIAIDDVHHKQNELE